MGCKVDSLDEIPTGMIGQEFKGGLFEIRFKRKPNKGVVYQTWEEIWKTDLNRDHADFEVYGEKAQNPENAEVTYLLQLKHKKWN